jgi:hypothetical protein
MVDSLYQGNQGLGGTQNPIMSSEEYLSQAQRTLNNIEVRSVCWAQSAGLPR